MFPIVNKSYCSFSFDLDNQWSYMKTHGDTGWEKFPSYLEVLIPYTLDILEKLNIKITFFIVGQDAALHRNREALRLITDNGHEVGNHSFHHEPWVKLYSKQDIENEIRETEKHILNVTGQKPVGFRGPGFSYSKSLLEVLLESGYLYDASILPTYLGPLARMYYFWTSDLSKDERETRKELFGKISEGKKSIKPFYWLLPGRRQLLEIPVTTMPAIKSPFHLSYLLYLSRISSFLMLLYLNLSISLCRLTNTEPSFLLHPLDLLGGDQIPQLAFFPGMDLIAEHKRKVFTLVMNTILKHFQPVNMSAHAHAIIKRNNIRSVIPS